MGKAELKSRGFLIGLIAVALLALAGLGACGGVGPEELEDPPAESVLDSEGLVEVKVALPQQQASSSRSVADNLVETYADYYEVIFKLHDSTEYYIGRAEAGKGYLSVSVKPDQAYDILLLAGAKANRVLLATGFVNNATGNGYVDGGPGYTVEVGKANVISLTMHKTNITPDASADITFDGGTYSRKTVAAVAAAATTEAATYSAAATDVKDAADAVAAAAVAKAIEAGATAKDVAAAATTEAATYSAAATAVKDAANAVAAAAVAVVSTVDIATVEVDVPVDADLVISLADTKLQDLVHAGSSGDLFASNKVTLIPRYSTDTFPVVPPIDGSPGTNKYTYTFDKDDLPDRDVDGKLRLELQYFAFGDKQSGSSKWYIRNGLDYDIDDNGSGGSIRVKFGDGSSINEETTIEIDFL